MSSWKDGLSEEHGASPAFKDIGDDINDLAKNYLDAQAYLGNAIRIPGEDASKESISEFHEKLRLKVPGLMLTPDLEDEDTVNGFLSKLGRPDAVDGYEMPAVNGIDLGDDREKTIRVSALKHGLTVKQVKGFLGDIFTADAGTIEVATLDQEEALLGLKKEWGVTYDPKIKALKDGMLLSEAPTDLTDALSANNMPPPIVKWLSGIFAKFSSESTNLGDNEDKDVNNPDLLDPVEASTRANEIRDKMMKGDVPQTSPEYKILLNKLLKYEQMANPDSSKDINDLRAGFTSAKT